MSCAKCHPKIFNYFALNNTCKFNKNCAYLHIESKTNMKLETIEQEIVGMKDEIKKLTDIVKHMTDKLQEVIELGNVSSEKVSSVTNVVILQKLLQYWDTTRRRNMTQFSKQKTKMHLKMSLLVMTHIQSHIRMKIQRNLHSSENTLKTVKLLKF